MQKILWKLSKIQEIEMPDSPRSRRWRPKNAFLAGLPCCGLDAGGQDQPLCPAAFATVSTVAAEDRSDGQPPSPLSRRRQPRSAVVAYRLRHGLYAGDQDPPQWPAAFATVSTQAAEVRLFGRPPLLRSQRRRPSSAAVARLPRRGLDAGGRDQPQRPASLAAVSTPAAEDRRCGPPPLLRSRRRQPRFAAVARRLRHSRSRRMQPRTGASPPSKPLFKRSFEKWHGWCGPTVEGARLLQLKEALQAPCGYCVRM